MELMDLQAQAANGTSKTISYTPDADYYGSDSFVVQISDGNGGTDTITVNVTINNVNDPPVIAGDAIISQSVDEDNTLNFTLNASDADNDTITWSISSNGSDGTASAGGNGTSKSISYTPDANYNGNDSFEVQISDGNGETDTIIVNVTINPVNDPPEITEGATTSQTVNEDNTLNFTLNATDIDNDTITWSISTKVVMEPPSASGNGTSQTISYLPDANYNGSDSFVVQIDDGNSGTDTITVNVTISPVNDSPEITEGATTSQTVNEDNTLNFTLNAVILRTIQSLGLFRLMEATETLVFQVQVQVIPFLIHLMQIINGSDSFIVQISDGNSGTDTITVHVTISPVNDSPEITEGATTSQTVNEDSTLNFTLNATDIENDTITWSISTDGSNGNASVSGTGTSNSISYTPDANYNGSDSFVVQIDDGNSGTDTITVNVTINNVNDPPVITEGATTSQTVNEDNTLNFTLNATDIDNDTITWSISTNGSNGAASASGNGTSQTISYTPNADYNGSDSFVVQISDGNGGTDTITVHVTISPVNDSPEITEGATTSQTVNEDSTLNFTLNATDIENDTITWSILTDGSNGTASASGTGSSKTISYTPDANYNGSDSFVVQISDGSSGTDTITVNVTINNVNDPPVITEGAYNFANR
jgi:hypothetical protein